MVEVLPFVVGAIHGEEVRGFLHFAQRFHAILAHFERNRCRNIVNTLFDEFGRAAQDAVSSLDWGATPARKRRLRSGHRQIRLLNRRLWESSEHVVAIDGRAQLLRDFRRAVRSVDEVRVYLAELATHARQCRLEPLVQLGGGIEHG